MKKKLVALMVGIAMTGALAFSSTASAAPKAPPQPSIDGLTAPVTGTVAGTTAFAGTFTLDRFTASAGQLQAVGDLVGTLTTAAGPVAVDQAITLPVAQANGTCDILHLVLGPLDLNLLGRMVHLDQVVLDITAQQGPGNLLGNLLCAVAGLLDSNARANTLANVLNQLLGLLGL